MTAKKQMTGKLGVALALALLVPVALGAQQHRHNTQDSSKVQQGHMTGMMGMGGMMGMMQGGDMMGMSPVMRMVMRMQPRQILAYADTLELTDEQVSHIETLETEQEAAHQEHMRSMMNEMKNLSVLLEADETDMSEIRTLAERAMRPYHAMSGWMIVDAGAVKELLTPAQREVALGLPIEHTGTMMMQGNRGPHNPGTGPAHR